MRKPFNRTLYNNNDKIARKIGKAIAKVMGYKAIDNEDKYGIDLLLSYINTPEFSLGVMGMECEIKQHWQDGKFPFDTIQIPERKSKWAVVGNFFMVANGPLTQGLILGGSVVGRSPLKEVPNKYVPKGEKFFQVSVAAALFYTLDQKFTAHTARNCTP